MEIKSLELTIIIIYCIVMISMGFVFRKRASMDTESFFHADRKLKGFLAIGALGGSYLSATSIIGGGGVVYSFGLAPLMSSSLAIALTYMLWLPLVVLPLRRANLKTVGEFFTKRYDEGVGYISSLFVPIIMFVYLIAQVTAGGTLLQYVTGLPYIIGVILIGITFISYVFLGGRYAANYTSVIQFVLFTGGNFLLLIFAINYAGGISSLFEAVTKVKASATAVWGPFGPEFDWTFGVIFLLGVLGSPHLLMLFYSMKDDAAAKKTIGWSGFFACIFYPILGISVIGVIAWFPDLPKADFTYLQAANFLMPRLLAGVVFAGILGASMSTTDAQLITAGSSLSHDVINKWIYKGKLSEQKVINITKGLSVCIGVLAMVVAVYPLGLVTIILTIALSLMAGVMTGPVLLGIWWRKASALGAKVGMIGGILTAVILSPKIAPFGFSLKFFWSGIWAFIVCVGLIIIVSLFSKEPISENAAEMMDRMR
jgi:SSS family transporter